MDNYINTRKELPPEGQVVHIVVQSPYGMDTSGDVVYATARLERCESDANNPVSYLWRGACSMVYSGLDVLYWEAIKEPEGLKSNPDYLLKCGYKVEGRKRFEEQYSNWDLGIEDDLIEALNTIYRMC